MRVSENECNRGLYETAGVNPHVQTFGVMYMVGGVRCSAAFPEAGGGGVAMACHNRIHSQTHLGERNGISMANFEQCTLGDLHVEKVG